MLVATFNATTGWAGRQITWQDERFILDGHGAITAADVAEYDRRGHLDWPSEEMHSWLAARLSWEQAVAAQPSAAPAYTQPAAEPVRTEPAAPVITPAPVVAAADEPVVDEAIVTSAADEPGAEEVAGTTGDTGGESAPPEGPAVQAAAVQPAAEPADEVRDVLVPGGEIVDVVGAAPYQEALAAIAGGGPGTPPDVEVWAHLIPEPDNPWDRNAVAVYVDGRKAGYLPRETSAAYAALLGRLWTGSRGRAVCRAVISGGWRQVQSQVGSVSTADEEQLGVRLALAAPEHIDVTQSFRQLTAEELAAGPPAV